MASFKTMLENVYSYNPFKCLTTLTVITDPYLAYCYSILNAITKLCLNFLGVRTLLNSSLYLSIFSTINNIYGPNEIFFLLFIMTYILHILQCIKLSVQNIYSRIIHKSRKAETLIYLNG